MDTAPATTARHDPAAAVMRAAEREEAVPAATASNAEGSVEEESSTPSESKYATLTGNPADVLGVVGHGKTDLSNESSHASTESGQGDGRAIKTEQTSTTLYPTLPADEQPASSNAQQTPMRHLNNATQFAGRAARQVPKYLRPPDRFTLIMSQVGSFCAKNLNFYRIHLLLFTFTPLIFSGIFYASNVTPIPYIDCLFVCFSAMTVTGLSTINLSTATAWQQAILYFLMSIGHISFVSIIMLYIRRYFFQVKFDSIIRRSHKARKRMNDVEYAHQKEKRKDMIRLQRLVGLRKKHKYRDEDEDDEQNGNLDEGDSGAATPGYAPSPRRPIDPSRRMMSISTDEIAEEELKAEREARKKERQRKKGPLRADMIRRMDQPAVLINPMGAISTTIRNKDDANEAGNAGLTRSISGAGIVPSSQTGGILNTTGGEDANLERLPTADTPNIRIAEPPLSPRKASDGAEPMLTETPEQLSTSTDEAGQNYLQQGRRRSSLSFRDPSAQQDGYAGMTVESAPAWQADDRSRARFTEEPVESDIARFRRGSSDPPVGARAPAGGGRHVRHDSDHLMPRPAFRADMFPRAQTIEFADPPNSHPTGRSTAFSPSFQSSSRNGEQSYITPTSMRHRSQTMELGRTPTYASQGGYGYGYGGHAMRRTNTAGVPMSRTMTMSKQSGFGGFPTPFEVAGAVIKRALPGVQERFKRSTTMARTATFASTNSKAMKGDGQDIRSAPYLSFDATVSRNSRFHQLSETQRDELGGVEYRAIDLLAKLLPLYWLILYFFCIVLVAPWLAAKPGQRTRDVLATQGQYSVSTTWFWFFQVTSAYSNTGFSLIDTSMIQLNDQYMMLIPMAFMILAGNTAFPIFLRLFIWLYSRIVPSSSRTFETLRFLLDHPRRCFVYLFPSAQTWFLLMVLIVFNSFDWLMFEVLDLNNPALEAWGKGTRAFDGLFQSIAVRAAGFQIVSILVLAPAVQFLYIVMMYISAYPVAMSVRNTNVYEEKSLGIFNDDQPEPGDAPEGNQGGARVWGTYLAAHARRQLAFDMWWLGLALWLVCIIEREKIQDPNTNGWFTVFSCLFELTSAYGTVGLSTGTPEDNFSLSGRFHTLSKLVVIAVMLRGRHRGLPVAIDRAVLLPGEFNEIEDNMPERAYTIDEDGFIRSRSTVYAAGPGAEEDLDQQEGGQQDSGNQSSAKKPSEYNFPRSATGASLQHNPSTPRAPFQPTATGTPRMRRPSRERSMPLLNLDHSENYGDEQRDRESSSLGHGPSLHPMMMHHQLSSIREASGTPLPTPSPDEQQYFSRSLDATAVEVPKRQRSSRLSEEGVSSSSSSSGSSVKGKGRERAEDATDARREHEFATRYGS